MKQNNQNTNILLIDCPDKKGLIYNISGMLYKNGFNIICNREFVDQENEHFYMRTEFAGEINDKNKLIIDLQKILPNKFTIKIPERKKKKIVILTTSEHHCLGDLLIRNEHNDLNIQVKAIISNHDNLSNLVKKFNLPFHYIPNEKRKNEEHEQEILTNLQEYNPDLIVLAKYMRILSPKFVLQFKDRIINIHHSFLPAFAGANPYKQAYKRGVKIIGATAHFVNDELDKGPIIVQEISHIDHTYDVESIKQAGRDIEKIALVKALRLVCDDRVFLNGNKTIVF